MWARVKETTNTALAWSQIKTNSLKAYLFTQEINPFELCTICYTTYLWVAAIFLKQKWTQAALVSLQGPAVEAGCLTQVRETETKLESNLLQVSLRRGAMLILALAFSPYQQILPFFPDMLAQKLTGELGKKKKNKRKGEKKGERGEKQP